MLSQENTTLCPNCDENIESSKYFLHERMCSLNVKKCPKCNKPYNIDDLNDHITSVHSFTICDLCNMKIPNLEIEDHKQNCPCKLTPCRYCELSVLLKELEEHENICGSMTEKCSKCGLYIEKRNYAKHVCLNKEIEYFNENIKIDNEEEIKKEKKMIKKEKKRIKYELEKNTYKANKELFDVEGKNKNFEKYFEKNKNYIEINQELYEGNTLLILSAKEGNYYITKFLCERKAEVNLQNNIGNTALHYAIGKQFYAIADILTRYGAREDIKNAKGLTPWDCIEHNIE